MSGFQPSESADDQLIRRQLDGLLSDSEFTDFNSRLTSDAAFRRRFLQLVDLESALYETFGSDAVSASPPPLAPRQWPWIALTIASVCAAGLVIAVLNFLSEKGDADNHMPPIIAEIDQAPAEPAEEVSPSDTPTAHVPTAVVVGVSTEFDGNLRIGQRLESELVKFSAGQLQLEFMSGARVALAGPAELQIESPLRATLKTGKAATFVPPRARGFVLNGPGAAVVDLGTEFRMSVDADGMTEVAVTNGEIELSLLGEDGNTLVSKRLNESGSVRFGNGTGSIEDGTFDANSDFPSTLLQPVVPLRVSESYVADVLSLDPQIYWRFEDVEGNVLSGETQQSVNAMIYSEASEDCVEVRQGHVSFRRDDGRLRYLRSAEPIAGLASGPLSFEFWMWPEDLQHSTCLGVYPDDDAPGQNHLNVIEVVSDTFLIHEPGAVRFLVRSPPERDSKYGVNAFTPGICTPGQWQHVVAVWDVSEIRLYVNGQLQRRVGIDQPFSGEAFHVILGQLKPFVAERQFAGAIDEFVVYRTALSDRDVERHFQKIAADNPHCTAQPTVSEAPQP